MERINKLKLKNDIEHGKNIEIPNRQSEPWGQNVESVKDRWAEGRAHGGEGERSGSAREI